MEFHNNHSIKEDIEREKLTANSFLEVGGDQESRSAQLPPSLLKPRAISSFRNVRDTDVGDRCNVSRWMESV